MKPTCNAIIVSILAMPLCTGCFGGLVMDNFDWDKVYPETDVAVNTESVQPSPSLPAQTMGNPERRDENPLRIQECVECTVCKGSGMAARQDDFSAYPELSECWNCRGNRVVWVATTEATHQAYQSVKDYVNRHTPGSLGETTTNSSMVSKKTRLCPGCDGKGYAFDSKEYAPRYSGTHTNKWCEECHEYGESHYHKRPLCQTCNGKKQIEDPYTF